MLVIKNQRYGYRNYMGELRLCRKILEGIQARDILMNFYWKFPDKSRGELIKSEKIDGSFFKDIVIQDYVNLREYPIQEIIVEFEFILKVKEKEISGYLRVNNEMLRKNYGDIEMDIYPFENISNLGDLIFQYKLENIKNAIENAIVKYSKEFEVPIKEAYISVSVGEPSIDLSKRIWIYYSNPIFLVADLISFIRYFEEIEIEEGMKVPPYLLSAYEEIIHKLKPYNIDFLSREFMNSEKFVKRFELVVKEKEVSIKKGSLILSSDSIENNFLLARDLSEKMIFPVMKQVTGDKEFKEILDKSL